MGTLFTKFHYYEDNLIEDNSDNEIYIYNGSIKYSNIDCLKENDEYKIYLCENDLILENDINNYTFLYQNISHWVYSKNSFGFFLKSNNNSDNKLQIVLNVIDGEEIANNLKKITTELVEYYKNL
tara:strand:- start:4492 stop:4866 length:375 start_codon:yes stop_codon:yes gene_type:complete